MSIFGILLAFFSLISFLYALILNRLKEYKFFYFKLSLFISVFINMGYFLSYPIFISFSEYIMISYLILSIFINVYIKLSYHIDKKTLINGILLFLVISISLILLTLNINYPNVIPYTVSADSVYLGTQSLIHPSINKVNFYEFIKLIIFVLYILECKYYFINEKFRKKLLNSIINMYVFISIIYILEFILNNFVDKNLFCNVINHIFGVYDYRTYTEPLYRSGIYTCKAFFTEPSYVTLFIPYFLIRMKEKLSSSYDLFSFIICIMAVLTSGSSSILMIIPIILLSSFMTLNVGINSKGKILKLLLVMFFLLILIILFMKYLNVFDVFINYSIIKIKSYINGEGISLSGNIRNFGNNVCYKAFLNKPLFGLGIGTIKGYGIIPGILGSIGLLGVISYLAFIINAMQIRFKDKRNYLISIVIIGYFSTILTVYYIYMPAILLFFIPLKTGDNMDNKQ